MRLWTVHPQYLDARGLVALWREALLARAVLRGQTRGYRHHPQLVRFRGASAPIAAVNRYLEIVFEEATRRGYHFDASKLGRTRRVPSLPETEGQLEHEWAHLLAKLRSRAPARYRQLRRIARPLAHPLFRVVPGQVRGWEKSRPARRLNDRA